MRIAGRRTAVVVAHPDDETVGCGALLSCLEDAVVVVSTDGAPRDLRDAQAAGFETAAAYATARRRELEAALAIAGCDAKIVLLGFPDQESAAHLPALTRRIAAILRRSDIHTVITHAYEGGHPDHDATAFAVHGAVGLLAFEGRKIDIVEMPLYSLGACGPLIQKFPDSAGCVLRVGLSPVEQGRKRRMIAAYSSQQATLAGFDVAAEYYRAAPRYDFSKLPNDGQLFYERFPWGMTGRRWLQLAREARHALRLDEASGGNPAIAAAP